MKYDHYETCKTEKILSRLRISPINALNPDSVAKLSQFIMPDRYNRLGRLVNGSVNHTKSKRMIHQMVARDILKIAHKQNGATFDAGYVYALHNKAWPGYFKIGSTIDVPDRNSNFQTYSPHRDYELDFYFFSFDRRYDEKILLEFFNADHEWVKSDDFSIIKNKMKEIAIYR